MSRQFDEYMSDKFYIGEVQYSLIEPTNFNELMQAYGVKNLLENQYYSCMHDDEGSGNWLAVLQEQETLIQEYLNSVGEFDNTYLISNINYLANKNGLGIGELEKILGLSAGYISRTAKTDSKKKLSIDSVWKIAEFFEVNIDELINGNIREISTNTDLIVKFLDKLCNQTKNDEIEWEQHGGYTNFIQDKYKIMGLITEETNRAVYHSDHLNPDIKWMLCNDIFSCKNISADKEFAIIPFESEESKFLEYDFIFIWKSKGNIYNWEKAFYSSDDMYGKIKSHADTLYSVIQAKDADAKVSSETRNFIIDYLK